MRDLAKQAGVTSNKISRIKGSGAALAGASGKTQPALENGGVEFMPTGTYQGEGGPGVRLKEQQD
ncbi:transcriptional regulator [Azospirillum sp. OGB3]|uniref:transcriptional regulator n=1 Tax=Azospirillum sp. OGB3 TaxID=2587012 RepID=UPI001B3B702E|nr:transcriptional regulator [Azospirillum sp. OGB3]